MIPSVRPEDVVQAACFVSDLLVNETDKDWTVPAGTLEWDVRHTLVHVANALAKYSLSLSSRTARAIVLSSQAYPDANNIDLLHALSATSESLAFVAESAVVGARGFHPFGMADAEGFIAMGCGEILVHGADVAAGLGLSFSPPDSLCRRVVSRVFPWAPEDTAGWDTLLWATGRKELSGHKLEPQWSWYCAPLREWDGTIPRWSPPLPTEYVVDGTSGGWKPRTD